MRHNIFVLFIPMAIAIVAFFSCNDGFLETKPDKALLVPETLEDFEYLLNNIALMNNRSPYLQEVAADDYFTTDAGFSRIEQYLQDAYIWVPNEHTISFEDWTAPYLQIFYANTVLDGLEKIDSNLEKYNKLKGGALFFRAMAMYSLLQEFAEPYNEDRADEILGLPYPLDSDVNKRPERSTLRKCYTQMIQDIKAAESLLPLKVAFPSEPSGMAAKALLMRVYLVMANYDKAETYAENILAAGTSLMDYNDISATPSKPLVPSEFNGNPEVIFYTTFCANTYILNIYGLTFVDTLLYASYDDHDLRKSLFFKNKNENQYNFRGSYTIGTFTGLAVDEVYLVGAECRARRGDREGALEMLNALLEKRWKKGTFEPMEVVDSESVLKIILIERRKELVSRGVRWSDLRRLNPEEALQTTIEKRMTGENYVLPPNDKRYTFPLPEDELSVNDIEQNPQ